MPPVTFPEVQLPPTHEDTSARPRVDHHARSARVRWRRAAALMVMTFLLPGSAQLVAGRRAVGRVALLTWLVLLALGAFLVGLGAVWHGFVFWLGSSPAALAVLRVVLSLVAVGWALLLIDAWRLGRPEEISRRPRLALLGLNGVLVFSVAGALLFASHLVAVQRDFIVETFGGGTVTAAEHGRYNILLIGGDAGEGRWGLRTDSMTVASVDEETGRTVLFGLPRNMAGFPFPEGTPLAKAFPQGYDCEGCTLNSLATWAADHPDEFTDSATPGIEATIEGIEGITGLSINYYVLVDMGGFQGLVRAMGGLTLNVRDRIPIGVPVHDYIEPGIRKLNGFETLWFARSRESADDYSRMARQKCVINAMVQQLNPQTVITKFQGLMEAGGNLIETDLPASELDTFAQLALKAKAQKIGTVSFVPPAVSTSSPDIDKIRSMIDTAIERSEAPPEDKAKAKAGKGFAAQRRDAGTGGSIGSYSQGYAANETANLSAVC